MGGEAWILKFSPKGECPRRRRPMGKDEGVNSGLIQQMRDLTWHGHFGVSKQMKEKIGLKHLMKLSEKSISEWNNNDVPIHDGLSKSEEKYWGKAAKKRLENFEPKKAVSHEIAWKIVEAKK